MMRPAARDGVPSVLARAISTACEAAKWEALDLLSRRGRHLAPDLMRGHSAELAFSPMAQDQLLSLALDQAARSLDERGILLGVDLSPLLQPICLPSDRESRILEAAMQRDAGADLRVDQVIRAGDRAALKDQADLCGLLWRELRIPADDRTRAEMLAMASRLAGRLDHGPSKPRRRR